MKQHFPFSPKQVFASHPQTDMAHYKEANSQIQDYRIKTLDFEHRLVNYECFSASSMGQFKKQKI